MAESTKQAVRAEIVTCPSCGKSNRVPAAAPGVPRCGNCKTPLPWLTTADDSDFEEVVVQSSVPVLLDLWAPWCGPCRMVAPGVERASQQFAGRLKAVKVNVDNAPQVATRFNVQSIPMLLVLDHGQVVAQQIGAVPPEPLLRWVEGALPEAAA